MNTIDELTTNAAIDGNAMLPAVPSVCLAWATKKRHIAVDGKVLCQVEHRTTGYSVKNGQYNTLTLSGLPTYERKMPDAKFSHGDGYMPFLPIEEQPLYVDKRSVCSKCLLKYAQLLKRHGR